MSQGEKEAINTVKIKNIRKYLDMVGASFRACLCLWPCPGFTPALRKGKLGLEAIQLATFPHRFIFLNGTFIM